MNQTLKRPEAWLPIALSLAMLSFMLVLFTTNGIPTPEQNADEGVGAHLFQLWLVLEVLMIPFFAIKWLPERPKATLIILAIQIAAALLTCAPVRFFHL